MTRKKKTRSLKRIFSVKTGNKAKLKRASDNDRQNSARFSKSTKKQKSAYQKFLDENPDAVENKNDTPQIEAESVAPEYIEVNNPVEPKSEEIAAEEKEDDLLDLFEHKKLDDFY